MSSVILTNFETPKPKREKEAEPLIGRCKGNSLIDNLCSKPSEKLAATFLLEFLVTN